MNHSTRSVRWALTAALLVAPLGCSFSHSSKSSSDSSTSPSKSSQSSSGEKSARFQQDVEHYTAAWVSGSGRGEAAFLSGLGDLARERGISDWEAEPGTWESIGRGLGRADVDAEQSAAYARSWSAGDAERQDALLRGYGAAR
jgi:hypothetical protein